MKKKYPLSDHYDGKHFFNEDRTVVLKNGWMNVLKWRFKEKRTPWPKFIDDGAPVNLPLSIKPNHPAITFINHATFLIQFPEINILTDPVFSKRVSPFRWMGPQRMRSPGIPLNKLPKIDIVTISHNHYDHLDIASLKKLQKLFQPLFVVPLGNAKLLKSKGMRNVIELDWWESTTVKNCEVVLVPAQHWSARGFHDRCKSLWGGYVYRSHRAQIFFAGDTGYNRHFKEVYEKYGAMTVSLLPIGCYQPRWFMKEHHMNPEESVMAHLDLHSKLSIGMHFGTFCLADEGHEHPLAALAEGLKMHQVDQDAFITLRHGETKMI